MFIAMGMSEFKGVARRALLNIQHNEILISKLYRSSIRGNALQLLRNNLSFYSQCDHMNKLFPAIKQLCTGLLQGSVLGHLSLNMCTKDIINISTSV